MNRFQRPASRAFGFSSSMTWIDFHRRHLLLAVVVVDLWTDIFVHEIADAIAERSLSFRKVKVQGAASPLPHAVFAADFR